MEDEYWFHSSGASNVAELHDNILSTHTRARHRGKNHSGLKVSKSMENSQMKAWVYLFTDPLLLHKIVSYTNDCVNDIYSKFVDMGINDLKD